MPTTSTPPAESGENAHRVVRRPPRVLIVDNERSDRMLLELMLAPEGLRLVSAASGEEALAMVAQRPPDLILLDVMMPGLDGYHVAARLKGDPATRDIPIILVTELDDREARLLGLTAGAEEFLSKPIDRAELRIRVRNLLRLKADADDHDRYGQMLERQVDARTAALFESDALYRSTFDAAPVGIVHVGLDGEWLRVNQRLCAFLDYPCAQLQSERIQQLVQRPEDIASEAVSFAQLAAGTIERHTIDEKRYQRRDGTFVWARVNTSVHRDAEGQARHFISVIEDITERRTLEAQVRQASKMDAIGRVASGVAHDFNNLLTVILGFAEILLADLPAAGQPAKDVGEIVKAAERASGLTRQLLAFGRQQVLHAAPLDVNALITDMTGMLGRLIGSKVEVTLALAPGLSTAFADRGQLEQVVMNLVVNARDAMPDGGRVTIETSEIELENSSAHEETIMNGAYVMIAITDTGTGMDAETKRRLFEPFFTTKDVGKGTGLGLSTTYGIVKQSKGYIWVYSEPGHGTTFKVYLPRSGDAMVVAPPAVAGLSDVESRQTVLLVEDEIGMRRLTNRILSNAGYLVLEAADGDEAEVMFGLHADTIDLVLTDMIMPGCGGRELARRLRLRAPAVRMLYMSGFTEQSAVPLAGLDDDISFVQKPFTAAGLVAQVVRALATQNQAAPGSTPVR
jgi:PAS domain S-box-containing protein